jgi:beta-N-acetylhexosaminidase
MSYPRSPISGLARAASLLLTGVLLSGCIGSSDSPAPGTARPTQPVTASPVPTPTPTGVATAMPTQEPTQMPTVAPTPGATPTTAPTTCAIQTLNAMSEAQRIGQLFMVGLTSDGLTPAVRAGIAQYHFGSVLFARHTGVGVAGLRTVSDAVQALATSTATHGVPFFVAANQEGGLVQALAGPGFDTIPSALDQGAMSPSQLRSLAKEWGSQLLAAGVNMDLAPVADVVPPGTDASNAPIGALDREYGHDPDTVASHVVAFIEGMHAAGVSITLKHFPGLGRVTANTDSTADVVDSVTTRHDPYLLPFGRGIAAGARGVMISLATYTRIDPAHLAAFSDTVINGMLRGDLGFRGIVMSDSLSANAVLDLSPATRALDFLDGGGDMIVLNDVDAAGQMASAIATFATQHDWFAARVDNAAWHVLRGKEEAGLLTCG